jgi:hypothetical protein
VSFASSRLKGDIAIASQTVNQLVDNVVDIFTGKPLSELSDQKIIRVAAELDGLKMLYSNSETEEKLFSIIILPRDCGAVARYLASFPGLMD